MTDQDTCIVHQPLPSTLLDKLDPEYIAFHNEYMQYVPRDESKIWDGSARTTPSLPYGGSPLVPVGDTRDIGLGDFSVRIYTPEGEPSIDGWPAFVWFHGGGWAIGGLDDSADFLTRVCRGMYSPSRITSHRHGY
jgi:acetyl esterase/lipase